MEVQEASLGRSRAGKFKGGTSRSVLAPFTVKAQKQKVLLVAAWRRTSCCAGSMPFPVTVGGESLVVSRLRLDMTTFRLTLTALRGGVVDDEVEVVFGAAKEFPGRLPKAIAPTVAAAVSPSFGGHARLKAPRNAMTKLSCVRSENVLQARAIVLEIVLLTFRAARPYLSHFI